MSVQVDRGESNLDTVVWVQQESTYRDSTICVRSTIYIVVKSLQRIPKRSGLSSVSQRASLNLVSLAICDIFVIGTPKRLVPPNYSINLSTTLLPSLLFPDFYNIVDLIVTFIKY